MLRITTTRMNEHHCIRLEGKLLEPWVEEVARLFPPCGSAPLPRLDLLRVTFVDSAGADLLRELLQRGVHFESFTPYVAELLHLEGTEPERNADA